METKPLIFASLQQKASNHAPRIDMLDALRGIAVLLVIGRHYTIQPLWKQVGWCGVDIFFVLSGFLVSGLLFREYKLHGRISISRFWMRRGFRIYPPFLVMLAGTVLLRLATGVPLRVNQILSELTWTQNYFRGLWVHTWSLAVEEHFYLLLPVLLLILLILGDPKRKSDPFHVLPAITFVVSVAALAMRAVESHYLGFEARIHLFPTHLRIDALLFGAMVSYFYWFHRETLLEAIKKRRLWLGAGTAFAMAPVCFFPVEHWLMHTLGLTFVYIGAAFMLLLALLHSKTPGSLAAILMFIGKRSYSIYLWHLAVLSALGSFCMAFGLTPDPRVYGIVYVFAAMLVGFLMYSFVEAPSMRLRDHFFPAKQSKTDRSAVQSRITARLARYREREHSPSLPAGRPAQVG